MNQEIVIFQNKKLGNVRVVLDEKKEPLFCLKDVCNILGIVNPSNVKKRIKSNYLQEIEVGVNTGLAMQNIKMLFVNEAGLYDCIFASNKEEATIFKEWVFEEVLPSIRKTGKYEITKNNEVEKLKIQESKIIIEKEKLELKKQKEERIRKKEELERLEKLKESLAKYGEDKIQIIDSKIAEINGLPGLIPLPNIKKEEVTFSATDICKKLKEKYDIDISVQKFGKLSNENNLKIDKYGKFYRDKSKYSDRIVETFRYYENVLEAVKDIISADEGV